MLKTRGICVVDKTEKSLHVSSCGSLGKVQSFDLSPFLSVPPPLDSSVRICYVFPSYKFENVLCIKPNMLGYLKAYLIALPPKR